MKPDINSVVQTLLQENANLTLQVAQYKSLVEQYENQTKEEEK
ncbi:hypothetical protein [Leuconostoc falkenbergense]|nr:hypothetical protein [Leuconostoc falkenbergense]